jgi:hypothetical protein
MPLGRQTPFRFCDSTNPRCCGTLARMLSHKIVRKFALRLAFGLLGAILAGLIAEWFIHVLEDKGWYRNAGAIWDRGISGIVAVLASEWLRIAAGVVAGFAAGMRTDSFLLRRENGPTGITSADIVPLPAPNPTLSLDDLAKTDPRLRRALAMADREEAEDVTRRKMEVQERIDRIRQDGPCQRDAMLAGPYFNDMDCNVDGVFGRLRQFNVDYSAVRNLVDQKVAAAKGDALNCTIQPGDEVYWHTGPEKQQWKLLMTRLDAYEEVLNDLGRYKSHEESLLP